MKKSAKQLQLLVLSAMLAALAACGGGGGGGDPAAAPPPPPAAPAPSTPPASTYAPGSAQKAIFDQLNQVRINGGFGALGQDAGLDQAAKSHADYVTVNYYPSGIADPFLGAIQPDGAAGAHHEIAGKPGFTGATIASRISAGGYTAAVGSTEVMQAFFGQTAGAEPDMTQCLSSLLNTVFHRAALLDVTMQHIGIGIGAPVTDAGGSVLRPCVMDMATKSMASTTPTGWSGIFPFDGQTGVSLSMKAGEVPDPAPSVAVKGYPISLQTGIGQNLVVSSFNLKDANGSVVNTVLLTKAASSYLRTNEAYLVPIGALRANSTYTVAFTGTSNGTGINRTWTFTTGQ